MTEQELIKAVKTLLTRLVSPKFNNEVGYKITAEHMSMDNITNWDDDTMYFVIDMYVNPEEYWKVYNDGDYDSPSEFDDDIAYGVKSTLRYMGVNKSHVYIMLDYNKMYND